MKTRSTRSLRRLQFRIRFFCDYADQIGQLEKTLARKPEKLQLDIIGSGELSPETQAEVTTLKERAQAAQAYTSHPALLRLEELATLRQLASSGNARLYIDFQKNGQITPEQS